MMAAWADSDRRSRLPGDWRSRRARVLDRDGGRCTWIYRVEDQKVRCSAPATEVDHIKNNDDHSLENLRGLCHEHHAQKTQSESWASRARRMRQVKASFRRSEEHPAFAYMKGASGRR